MHKLKTLILFSLVVIFGIVIFQSSVQAAYVEFANPLKFTTVEGLITNLLGVLRGIIGTLSVVFIVIGAIMYITSAGDDKKIETAKGAITAAMIGLAIGVGAPSFLKEIYSIVGGTEPLAGEIAGATSITQIAIKVLEFLLSIVGTLAVIMMVIGGAMYVTAAGDDDKIETGKNILTYSIIGIAIALGALVLVKQVVQLFV